MENVVDIICVQCHSLPVPTDVVATDEFVEWYDDLDDRSRKSVMRAVDLLEQTAKALRHPHSSQIKGSRYPLRELRVQSGGHPLRVFYIFDAIRRGNLGRVSG